MTTYTLPLSVAVVALAALVWFAVREWRLLRVREEMARYVCRACGLDTQHGVDAGFLPNRYWLCRSCADLALGIERNDFTERGAA